MEGQKCKRSVVIACGGTGGHFFPGIAVARALRKNGIDSQLLVSSKSVDELGASIIPDLDVTRLPLEPFSLRRAVRFGLCFYKSMQVCGRLYRKHRPGAVLAMGGFASAPAVISAHLMRIPIFLHEANSIPGRANRLLARLAQEIFVYFPSAPVRLRGARVQVSGMPVRSEFCSIDRAQCQAVFGFDPASPVLAVTGGSQGARPLNQLMAKAVALLALEEPKLQYLHLTGTHDIELVRQAYRACGVRAVVEPFIREMWLVLGAATLALTRAGASTLAELAATRVPAILIPYPFAADNHQYYNAKAFADSGAAVLLPQGDASPEVLARLVLDMLRDRKRLEKMRDSLAKWSTCNAAAFVADRLTEAIDRLCAGVLGPSSAAHDRNIAMRTQACACSTLPHEN